MSTKAGTIEVRRPSGFTLWAAAVSVLAAAALIMSAVALNQAVRSTDDEAAGVNTQMWDAAKLEAMEGRALAATVGSTVGSTGYAPWDAGKLEAMSGRVLAATVSSPGYALWDAGKVEAMKGRALAG